MASPFGSGNVEKLNKFLGREALSETYQSEHPHPDQSNRYAGYTMNADGTLQMPFVETAETRQTHQKMNALDRAVFNGVCVGVPIMIAAQMDMTKDGPLNIVGPTADPAAIVRSAKSMNIQPTFDSKVNVDKAYNPLQNQSKYGSAYYYGPIDGFQY